jgi:acetoin utilization protein AcuB
MAKPQAPIQEYMTRSPHSIGEEQSLARAKTVMQEHDIRHLPVLHGGQLVGMVTDRDVQLVETLDDIDPKLVTVSDAMSQSVYAIPPDTPLEQVAAEMAARKYGSAVVMRGRDVVGIFTTVDACRALASLLREARSTPSAR